MTAHRIPGESGPSQAAPVELRARPPAWHITFGAVLLSAVLYRLAFPPTSWWPLAWVHLVPTLLVLRRAGVWRILAIGLLLGAFSGALISGVSAYSAVASFYRRPWYVALPFGAIVVPMYGVVYRGAAFAFFALLRRGLRFGFSPALVMAWFAADLLYTSGWGVLPWATIAVTQAPAPIFLQTADVGGAPIIGALITLVNGLIAQALWTERARRSRALLLPAAVVAVAAAYGAIRIAQMDAAMTAPGVRPIRVGVVQSCLRRKLYATDRPEDRVRVREMSVAAFATGAEVVLWPESSGGEWPFYHRWRQAPPPSGKWLMAGVRERRVVDGPNLSQITTNHTAAVWVSGDTGAFPILYAKRKLFPIGERPILGLERGLAGRANVWIPQRTESGPERPIVFSGNDWMVAPLICFEVLFRDAVRQSAEAGADWLAVLSNDEWFDATSDPVQHHGSVAILAVTTRRPVARASNTGVSGGFDAAGRSIRLDAHLWTDLPRAGPPAPGADQGPDEILRRVDYLPMLRAGFGVVTLQLADTGPPFGMREGWWLFGPLALWGLLSRSRSPVFPR